MILVESEKAAARQAKYFSRHGYGSSLDCLCPVGEVLKARGVTLFNNGRYITSDCHFSVDTEAMNDVCDWLGIPHDEDYEQFFTILEKEKSEIFKRAKD